MFRFLPPPLPPERLPLRLPASVCVCVCVSMGYEVCSSEEHQDNLHQGLVRIRAA